MHASDCYSFFLLIMHNEHVHDFWSYQRSCCGT